MKHAKRRSGRPRKAEEDKVQYQRIAIYAADYQKLVEATNRKGVKITDAITEMVAKYAKSVK